MRAQICGTPIDADATPIAADKTVKSGALQIFPLAATGTNTILAFFWGYRRPSACSSAGFAAACLSLFYDAMWRGEKGITQLEPRGGRWCVLRIDQVARATSVLLCGLR